MLLETDDEFSRDAVVVLEIKKNKLLMNVLNIMSLCVYFSLALLKENKNRESLDMYSLPSVSLQIPPIHCAERSVYQSHLSKGVPACGHHFRSSGHTHSLVITSRPQSFPSYPLPHKKEEVDFLWSQNEDTLQTLKILLISNCRH